MEIIIPLPNSPLISNYKELKGYLKQLELAVHHAQKSVEQFEKDEVLITENAFISFDHPALDGKEKIEETNYIDFVTNHYAELQNVQLRIVTE